MTESAEHPDSTCMTCGACCAYFRVSFYWAEAEANKLAPKLTERINERFSCMAGTNQSEPRCLALSGVVGESVACTVYENRTSPCREVLIGDAQCNRARAKWGMPLL